MHIRELEDGRGEVTVLDRAGNEGCPGDDGAILGGDEGDHEVG